MKPARIAVLGIALVAGGIAALLARGGHQAPPPPAPPAPVLETVDVLTAKADLARGQVIGEHDIGWQLWPKAAVNSSFIKKSDRPDAIKQFQGAIVRERVASGQPIYDPMVVFAKGSGFLAAVLPKGMRAVSLDIEPNSAAGGFILPGDHVDVVLTRRDKEAEAQQQRATGDTGIEIWVADTILRNVPVLAVDQDVEEKGGKKVAVGKTATIELTPAQTERLELSRQAGTLSLALRSLLDSQSDMPEDGDTQRKAEAQAATINTVRYGVGMQSLAH